MQTSARNFEIVQASNSTIARRFETNHNHVAERANKKAAKISNQGRTTRKNKRGQWEGEL